MACIFVFILTRQIIDFLANCKSFIGNSSMLLNSYKNNIMLKLF
jgi:hypothetical protein